MARKKTRKLRRLHKRERNANAPITINTRDSLIFHFGQPKGLLNIRLMDYQRSLLLDMEGRSRFDEEIELQIETVTITARPKEEIEIHDWAKEGF